MVCLHRDQLVNYHHVRSLSCRNENNFPLFFNHPGFIQRKKISVSWLIFFSFQDTPLALKFTLNFRRYHFLADHEVFAFSVCCLIIQVYISSHWDLAARFQSSNYKHGLVLNLAFRMNYLKQLLMDPWNCCCNINCLAKMYYAFFFFSIIEGCQNSTLPWKGATQTARKTRRLLTQ